MHTRQYQSSLSSGGTWMPTHTQWYQASHPSHPIIGVPSSTRPHAGQIHTVLPSTSVMCTGVVLYLFDSLAAFLDEGSPPPAAPPNAFAGVSTGSPSGAVRTVFVPRPPEPPATLSSAPVAAAVTTVDDVAAPPAAPPAKFTFAGCLSAPNVSSGSAAGCSSFASPPPGELCGGAPLPAPSSFLPLPLGVVLPFSFGGRVTSADMRASSGDPSLRCCSGVSDRGDWVAFEPPSFSISFRPGSPAGCDGPAPPPAPRDSFSLRFSFFSFSLRFSFFSLRSLRSCSIRASSAPIMPIVITPGALSITQHCLDVSLFDTAA
uniref:Uncharacterized protein n=1 Tax=Anopheles coluzzii TaxID=1518534 RepID=A0A8W7NZP8_ANOCL